MRVDPDDLVYRNGQSRSCRGPRRPGGVRLWGRTRCRRRRPVSSLVEGVGASPGRALGPICRLDWEIAVVAHRTIRPEDVESEVERFDAARAEAVTRLSSIGDDTELHLGPFEGKVFEAQAYMIEDPDLVEGTRAYITENFLAAERAFELQMLEHRVRMLDSGHAMVLDRLADLMDVRLRVLSNLLGVLEPQLPVADDEPVILVARDLPPSLAVRLDREQVAGFVTAGGSRGGHAVVIARSLGIPAVVGVGLEIDRLTHGERLLMDGRTGKLLLDPSTEEIEAYRTVSARVTERREAIEAVALGPTATTDGVLLEIQANVDRPDEIARARRLGAEGVGLLRTEFLVIGHREIPTEEEQLEAYRSALEAFPDRDVTLRTFDIGGDKFPLFLSMPTEENPYLGWRAIRVCLDLPELFGNQLRAAVRASRYGSMRILLPFITSIDEVKQTRILLNDVYASLGTEAPETRMPMGIMIETPAALEQIDQLAPLVDFLSRGTNDLTQYALAADRGNARLAGLFDAAHPALVQMYRRLVEAAERNDLEVSVCGELAGEPVGMALLVGLGYTKFSVSVSALAEQREVARAVSSADLAALVTSAWWPDAKSCRAEIGEYL
ncbi:MAG: phosphoenolpyruvate--protein phosphotransferase, partial [Gemmatimonadales bacterium]